ncbi:hypothetical protein MiTe_04146 [Microcystis aeruginosa NIES-2520]|jgi:hypothetical protein|uniref:Uncharacterized protein n=1 Tax=Microcystis aeruginosa NIES-2520 TaxID=2303982 RepID=A0A5A5RL31_MICAE|nr:hypothetical protein [Microcystis aeruginosa]GCA77293.1 hypothetical protein MiTe_04146 [Microcystis aeruginosa NIES-2520]
MKRISFEKLVLKEIGLNKKAVSFSPWWVAVPALLLVAITVRSLELKLTGNSEDGLATIIVTVAAIAVAYQQWIEAKNEASLDKYYERLNITNQGFYRWDNVREMFPHFWDEEGDIPYERVMYVYLELDNLEYVITKYQYSSMQPDIAFRSLVTFISRCQSKDFMKLAEKFVQRSIGYSVTTRAIVNKIANPCNISDPQIESWLYEQLEPRKSEMLNPQIKLYIQANQP